MTRREAIVNALLAGPMLLGTVPDVASSPRKLDPFRIPKILDERPPIRGVPGRTYFHVNTRPLFTLVFPRRRVFVCGVDRFCDCFEFDLLGQWAGVFLGETGNRVVRPDGSIARHWIVGHIELRRV